MESITQALTVAAASNCMRTATSIRNSTRLLKKSNSSPLFECNNNTNSNDGNNGDNNSENLSIANTNLHREKRKNKIHNNVVVMQADNDDDHDDDEDGDNQQGVLHLSDNDNCKDVVAEFVAVEDDDDPLKLDDDDDDSLDSCDSNTTVIMKKEKSFGCVHYKRRCMFVTPCCGKFYNCRFCHDENESHHFDRKTLTELICAECNTRQKVQERCERCGVIFGKYTCLICNLFDDTDKRQYHCKKCGICRIGGAENFFHCQVCNMCLPLQLKIDGHRCVENTSRSNCPICLGDIHTSRKPCYIPNCGHLLHQQCFDQLLASGHYTCPTCQTSIIDMTALWEYLDVQAQILQLPKSCENQLIHIFCNDCHKTCKTKFHFIGLKCMHCGAYNTTQDIKRRMSLVTDEPTSA